MWINFFTIVPAVPFVVDVVDLVGDDVVALVAAAVAVGAVILVWFVTVVGE